MGSDVSPNIRHIINITACVISAMSLLAVIACALVLVPLLRDREARFKTSGITRTVTHILIATLLHGTLMAIVNTTWVVNVAALNLPGPRIFFAVAGYLLPIWLFMSNIRLGLERLWLVQYSQNLPSAFVYSIYGVGLSWSGFFVAAFSLLNDAPDWVYWPFSMPGSTNPLVNILFETGMSIFPASCIAITAIYIRIYLVTASILSAARSDILESSTQCSGSSNCSIECSKQKTYLAIATTVKQQQTVLIRCAMMAVGIVVLYVPTIIFVMVRVSVAPGAEELEDSSAWVFVLLNILPALDVLYTPLLILWFQPEIRWLFADFLMNLL
ncbi:hypothetical protein HDU77_002985 [Chytriomyces hyalinus]|nr:hypothetical protein HDU77_002985 [Chytriomyces hyalinus]